MIYPVNKLSEVFRDTTGHMESSEVILSHSTNKEDIREFALRDVSIKDAQQVIDLGCGFGFFTLALKDKINDKAVVSGIDCFAEYREPYLSVCRKIGFKGQFYDSGMDALANFKSGSVDLVLSSFSIYFFPRVVSQVVSILRKTGFFILITHFSSHLQELTTMIGRILNDLGYPQSEKLPHDRLISNFPAEEGIIRLSRYFKKIEKREYENELVFTKNSIDELMKYIIYKWSFFIPEKIPADPVFFNQVKEHIMEKIFRIGEFRITKKDAVFICSQLLNN